MVTVELAVGMAVVVVILALVVALVHVGIARAQTCRSARDAVRQAATGASDASAVALTSLGIAGGSVELSREGRWVSAQVSVPVAVPLIPGARVSCRASTVVEQVLP